MKEGWEIKKLGDVCYSKSSNLSQNQLADQDGDYPIFGASGLIKNVSFYHRDTPYLSIVKDGSGFGRVTKMNAYTSVIGTLQYILPTDGIDLDYLYYSLISIDFKKYVSGAAIPHIYFKDYKNEPFLWMPLPEQQRIVAILDDAFAKIEKAKANAEQNLKNAKELFESYLQGVFENKGEDWEEKTLGEVASFRNGLNFAKNAKGEQIKIVGVRDFQNSFWVPTETLSNVNLDNKLHDFDTLRDGDIITVRSNGNPQLIGRTLLARNISEKISHSGFTIRIRLNDHRIDPEYLCNYVKTTKTRKILVDGGNGVSIKSLNQGSLSELVITYPNKITEQQNIVKHLNKISQQINKLEAIYEQKINDLEELKKSVLQKAFSGEL